MTAKNATTSNETLAATADLGVEPAVSMFTGKPFVLLRWHDLSGQFTPAEARGFAIAVLRAAETAEQDSAAAAWLKQRFNLNTHETAVARQDLKDYREHVHLYGRRPPGRPRKGTSG